ncbi:MAG: ABC transporter permease, partial [Flavisolibacter sp.]|nr:ABC transporter permease [Flavisolibacter sp.]
MNHMFRNYLKISLRNLWKNRLYSLINVIGLATGLTSVLLVTLFVKDEFSYDSFHANAPQLYRITTSFVNKDGSQQTIGASGQVQGPSFKAAVPEVLDYSRLMAVSFNVAAEGKRLNLPGLYADQSFFKLFSFPLLQGNTQTALTEKQSVILTEKSALKIFGRTDVVGKTLNVQDGAYAEPFTVTAVANEPPSNSSIQFEILVPFAYLEKSFTDDSWLNQYLSTFVLLHPKADPQTVTKKFSAVFETKAKEQIRAKLQAEGYMPRCNFGLQPITDIHLNRAGLEKKTAGGDTGGISGSSSLIYSYILMGIVGFMLLMAGINFVNLSIANAVKRAKEVGVRKIVGSSRRQIIFQFLVEAFVICLIAFGLALALAEALLPLFNTFVNKQLTVARLFDVQLLAAWCGVVTLSILLVGLYPAYVLSRFNPEEVLYNKLKLTGGHWLGKSLVVLQFSLAICLIVATIVYYTQMNFIAKKDLGYDPKDIVRVFIPTDNSKLLVERLKREFAQHPAIRQVATGADNSVPVLGGFPTKVNGKDVRYIITEADEAFLPMLKIPVKEGRNFSTTYGS